jgi:hypothetical protein
VDIGSRTGQIVAKLGNRSIIAVTLSFLRRLAKLPQSVAGMNPPATIAVTVYIAAQIVGAVLSVKAILAICRVFAAPRFRMANDMGYDALEVGEGPLRRGFAHEKSGLRSGFQNCSI